MVAAEVRASRHAVTRQRGRAAALPGSRAVPFKVASPQPTACKRNSTIFGTRLCPQTVGRWHSDRSGSVESSPPCARRWVFVQRFGSCESRHRQSSSFVISVRKVSRQTESNHNSKSFFVCSAKTASTQTGNFPSVAVAVILRTSPTLNRFHSRARSTINSSTY